MLLPYGQQPPPDAIPCPMADEPRHSQCRLCGGGGWVQRDAAVAAFQARRANAAARRRQPVKRPDPHHTPVPQPPASTERLPPTPTAAPAATLSSKEVATQLAVSYRQLHIWVTKGWFPGLVPTAAAANYGGPPSRSKPLSRSRRGWRSPARSKPTRPHPFEG
jgi:hypothetical protein